MNIFILSNNFILILSKIRKIFHINKIELYYLKEHTNSLCRIEISQLNIKVRYNFGFQT